MGKGFGSALDLRKIATPPTPAAGEVSLYAKSDGHIYRRDDGGTEERISGPPIGTAGGDLAGSFPNPTLASTLLNAIKGLAPAADKLAYFTSASAAALTDLSSYGRSLIAAANAGAARTLLDVYSKAESLALAANAEMGYAERTTNFTTTNTAYGSTAGTSLVGGLSVTVVGEGRPVDLEVVAIVQTTTAAPARVGMYFLTNGGTTDPGGGHLATVAPGTTNVGVTLNMRKRTPVLTNGVSYTFTVGLYGSAAGTHQVTASSAIPAFLSVTRR